MAEITVLVCDVDQAQARTVRHYTVTVEGKTTEIDLCDRHAGIFAPTTTETPARGHRTAVRAAGKPRRARASKVTTMEDIERMKQEG